MCLGVILSTLTVLFQLARTNGSFGSWHVHWFAVSCAGCIYILIMMYYVKAQRERATKASEEKYRSIIAISNMEHGSITWRPAISGAVRNIFICLDMTSTLSANTM